MVSGAPNSCTRQAIIDVSGQFDGAMVTFGTVWFGTHLGTWTWQEHDPTGIVSIGNPPSGAAGGYGWFDLAALLIAPGLIARWDRRRAARLSPDPNSLD
jgi:hypothetical protein